MTFINNIFNSRNKYDGDFFIPLRKILGFKPIKNEFYKKAFTHSSLNKRDKFGTPINYERLEFLGDAMISSIIATHLFNEVPCGDEGYLTKMRSKIVSRKHLNELGKELNLIDFVESKIPKSSFGDNIHGNLFESLVGAIFLDRGYLYCQKFIYDKVIIPHVDITQLEGEVISYKSLLIEWCQKEKRTFNYFVYEDTGNDDIIHFSVKLSIDKKVISKARATSKKKAEEKASKRAFFAFQREISKAV